MRMRRRADSENECRAFKCPLVAKSEKFLRVTTSTNIDGLPVCGVIISLRTDMTRFRTIMAFLIAPLIIPVGLSVAALVSPGDSPISLTDFLGLIMLFSLYALPVAYVLELLLGLPAWLFFRRHGIRAWSAYAIGGALLGVSCFSAYFVASHLVAPTITLRFSVNYLKTQMTPRPALLARAL